MYGELVKELRDSAEWADRLALLMGRAEGDTHAPIMRKAADAIEELSKKYLDSEVDNTNLTGWLAEEHAKNRWIPVTERKPKEYDEVLLQFQHNQASGFWNGGCWCVHSGDDFYTEVAENEGKPTHWTHKLPEPPKEET